MAKMSRKKPKKAETSAYLTVLEAPLDPIWVTMLDQIKDRRLRSHLRRVASYCSANGIRPEQVNDGVISQFADIVAKSGLPRPKQIVRDALKSWNTQVLGIRQWPQVVLTLIKSQKIVGVPFDQLPSSFRQDTESFLTVIGATSLFEAQTCKPLNERSQKDRKQKIAQLVGIFVQAGGNLSAIKHLRDLIAPDVMRRILEHMWNEGLGARNGHNHNRARLLRIIAQHHAKVSPAELEPFREAERKFRPKNEGLTPKNRTKLRPFLDDGPCRVIVGLPSKIIRTINRNMPTVMDAVRVQSALAVAILLNAPMRIRNLSSLELDRHVDQIDPNNIHLVIKDTETKNDQDLDYPLGKTAITILDLYKQVYRPLLVKSAQDKGELFISWNGVRKTEVALSVQLKKFIREETGYELSPHTFRHLVGLIFLKRYPGEYETVRKLLGHKDIRTTIKFYTGLEIQDAFVRLDNIMDKLGEPLDDN